MNHSLSPASIGGRTRRRRGGVEPLPQVVGGRKQRGGEDGEVVDMVEQIGGGYMMPKQRGGMDGGVEPVKGEGQNFSDEVMMGATTGGRKQRRRQTRRQSRRQARRQRKGGEKKSRSKSRSKSRQRR